MKFKTLFTIVFIMSYLVGCEKENDTVTEKFVVAGSDASNTYNLSPPFMSICERQPYDNGEVHGDSCAIYDSVDLDMDNEFDIEIGQYLKTFTPNDCDTTILDGCQTSGEEISYVKGLNGFQIAKNDSAAPFCATMPEKFQQFDTINMHNDWVRTNQKLAFSCNVASIWAMPEPIGYLGIRSVVNDTLYGWIKVEATVGEIIIDEYFLGN